MLTTNIKKCFFDFPIATIAINFDPQDHAKVLLTSNSFNQLKELITIL